MNNMRVSVFVCVLPTWLHGFTSTDTSPEEEETGVLRGQMEWVSDNDDCRDVRGWVGGVGGRGVHGGRRMGVGLPALSQDHPLAPSRRRLNSPNNAGDCASFFSFFEEVWKQSVRGKGLSEVLWKSLQTHAVPSPLPLFPSPLLPALPFVCVTDYSPDSRK